MTYVILFFSAFLAATLIPGSSEALLSALIVKGEGVPWILLAVATVGNVAGSLVNWICGGYLLHFADRSWFPVKRSQIDKATSWFQRYGLFSLLFAWLPIVGDPLTVVAGTLRVRLPIFLALVSVGKFLRYLFVFYVAMTLSSG